MVWALQRHSVEWLRGAFRCVALFGVCRWGYRNREISLFSIIISVRCMCQRAACAGQMQMRHHHQFLWLVIIMYVDQRWHGQRLKEIVMQMKMGKLCPHLCCACTNCWCAFPRWIPENNKLTMTALMTALIARTWFVCCQILSNFLNIYDMDERRRQDRIG